MSSQDRRFQVCGRPARVLHGPEVLQYIAHARARPRGLRAFKLSRSGISRYSNQANGRQGRPPAIAPCARGGGVIGIGLSFLRSRKSEICRTVCI